MEVVVTADANPTGAPPAGPSRTALPLVRRTAGTGERHHDDPMVIDCDRCSMRGVGCADCMVTVLLGGPPDGVELDDEERRAIDVLCDAGLIPPLRMVTAVDSVHIVE
jgi:hypothetical protein